MKKIFNITKVAFLMLLGLGTLSASAAYTEIEMGQNYSDFSLGNPTFMQWTAPSDGILTVRQYGTYDTHLFLNEECTQEVYYPNYEGSAPYILYYTVEANTTYYFKALLDPYDDLTRINFSFEATESDNGNSGDNGDNGDDHIATIGSTLSLSYTDAPVKFVPTETGILTVNTNTWSRMDTFLYLDVYHEAPVFPMETGDGPSGWSYKFSVTEGTSYYFYCDNLTAINFHLVSLNSNAVPTVEILEIYPTPGNTIDTNQSMTTTYVLFSTMIVSYGDAYISYTDKEGEPAIYPLDAEHVNLEGQRSQLVFRLFDAEIDGRGNTVYEQIKALANADEPWSVNVEDIVFNGNGILQEPSATFPGVDYISVGENNDFSISYSFMDTPELESETWPEVFYGYWAPGSPSAIATLTYDQELTRVSEVIVIMGRHIYGSEGGENIDASWNIIPEISGNTITINFAGIDYNASIIGEYSNVTVFIVGLETVYGFAVPVVTKYIPFSSETVGEVSEPLPYATVTPLVNTEDTPYETFSTVTLNYGEAVSFVEGGNFKVTCAVGTDAPVNVESSIQEGNLVIDFTELFPEGTVFAGEIEIKVPAGLVENSEGSTNPEQNLIYYLNLKENTGDNSGVGSIRVENLQNAEIYNLNGVKVKGDKLDKGIYIINGKKVRI